MRKAYNIIAPLVLVGAFIAALVWASQPDAGGAETPAPLPVPIVATPSAGLPACPTEDSQNCVWQHPRTGLYYVNGSEDR